MKRAIRKLIIFVILLIVVFAAIFTGAGYWFYRSKIQEKPISTKVTEIRNEFTYVKKDELPKYYLDAVVAVEDRRYYSHGPVDFIGVARALVRNISDNAIQEGGSTITQQVAQNMYYVKNGNSNSEHSAGKSNAILRKKAEMFVAMDLEKMYSKDDILEIYVNIIYFGNGYYGIREASEGYLKKKPQDLTLSEATMLAGIPNAPSVYAPTENKELCKSRQKKVIDSMLTNGYITQEQANSIDQSFIDKIE